MPRKKSKVYSKTVNPFAPFFEEGSEGSASSELPPSSAPSSVSGFANLSSFSGLLSIADGRVLLNSGGIEVEVLVADTVPTDDTLAYERERAVYYFEPYNGEEAYLRGEQRNGYILRASLAAKLVPASSSLDEATRQSFARIVELISAHREELFKPGVIAVRPGYRFSDGLITDEPAIVVVVDRKLEQSSLEPAERISPSIEGVPVDVAPATPLEQLQHRAQTGAPAALAATSLLPQSFMEEERLALPLWEHSRAETDVGLPDFLENLSDIKYGPPPDIELAETTDAMTIICHVSPDAGWPTLKAELFDRLTERMTIAMYDFTAPHILRSLRSAMGHAHGALRLILGPGASLGGRAKEEDMEEATIIERLSRGLRRRFQYVWARVRGPLRVFANSYHIKVAVADGNSLWLSSGNWQSSNLPDLEPLGSDASYPGILKEYNREWHVIVNHSGLAGMYEKFIEWDMRHANPAPDARPEMDMLPEFFVAVAELEPEALPDFTPRYFPPARFSYTHSNPLRVQPLLTPDNYAEKILPLIRSARKSLYFQNQSLSILENNEEMFDALINALRDKSRDQDIDVRIILRGEYSARKMLEAMKARGFDTRRVRWQDRCHTKGIVIDSRIAVVSSHNWTNSGTLYNRDAGLIFYDQRIARYYEDIFLYDWENLARRRVRAEEAMPVLAEPGLPALPGRRLVPSTRIFED